MAGDTRTLETKFGAEKYAQILDLIRTTPAGVGATTIKRNVESQLGLTVREATIRDLIKREFPDRITAVKAVATPSSTSPVAPAEVVPATPAQINNTILLRENARLKRQLAEREAGWEIIRETLEAVYCDPLNIAIAEPKESTLPGSPEIAVAHVTDVHYAKETPTYDIATCEARMLKYFNSVSEIVQLRRARAPIDECVLLLGGDMIEGEGIFPHQAWETQVDLIQQMVKGGPEYCVNLILSLAQLFPVVRVHAVPGNHGRQGKFMSPCNNADSVYYEIVRKMVQIASPETAKRIEWDLPLDRQRGDQWYSRFNIVGQHEGMLVHGDQIQGQLGFPWYGFGKKVNGWRNAAGTRGFTHLWSGHFHTHATFDLNDATVLSTGSPESSNGYALENMAAAGVPKQRLTFFNARYGIISDDPILLS